MAHNIGKMFYVGERPWHELGTALKGPVNMDRALQEGGLKYTVSMVPLAVAGEPISAVPQRMAVVRDDRSAGQNGRVLGVVHPNFKLLQNRDAAELFDQLFGKGGDLYHVGGYLKQGEIVWLQAKLPEPIVISDDDKLDAFLLFSNSHDDSYPIDIRITTVRVVCNNTLNLALRDKTNASARVFRRGHSQSVEIVKDEAEKFFETVLASQNAAQADLRRLAEMACDEEAFIRFLERVLPVPAAPLSASRNPAVAQAHATKSANIQASRAGVMSVHYAGYTDPLVPKVRHGPATASWWGALNSITAWVDHIQTVDGDRYAHQIFGGGSDIKTKALEIALSAIKV
jgi:phage/plasmid-like protein (TIGR03299 family)